MNNTLIIVDMINGFINDGDLHDKSIANIIPEIERLVTQSIANQDKIIAFKDCHTSNSQEFNSFPAHCIVGSDEVELVDELKKYEDEFVVFAKNSTSGMFVPEFFEMIKDIEDGSQITIVGCCTDICILNLAIPLKNYFNQFDKSVEIVVPKNAVDTYNIPDIHDKDEWNQMAFRFMQQAGVKVVDKLN